MTRSKDQLSTAVYRKLTHTDRYIPYHSHHHPRMLTVMRGMRDRALRICDNKSRQAEMEHLASVFEANGFPEKLDRKSLTKPQRQQTCEPDEEEPPKTLHLPYMRGLSEKIEKTCGPLDVKAILKPQSTLKQQLVRVKQKTPEEKRKEVVYQVPCKDCPKVYIGETKRKLKFRISEHKQAVKRGDEKNGIAVHAHTNNHSFNWEEARVHGTAREFWKRRTMEAIQIRTEPHNMNLDCGLHLSPVWYPIINSSTTPPPPPT